MDAIVDGVRLHYTQEGQGSDLFLVHGLGVTLHDWDACVPELARHHRVTRWDARGFGQSEKPAGPYSPQLFARDIAGVFRACGLTRAHVAGISMGGVIAQRFALDFPDLVEGLVLVSTSSEVGAQAHAAWEKTATIIEERGFSISTAAAQRAFSPGFVQSRPDLLQEMTERTARNDPHAYAAAARAIGNYNWTEDLRRLQAPTLILQGREDALTPPGGSIKMSRVLPHARLLMVPDCGHALTQEKPDVFVSTTLAFLAGVDFCRASATV